MLAISQSDIYNLPEASTHAKCPHCGKRKVIRYGEQILKDGKRVPSKMLGYVKCGKQAYVVAINGKLLEVRKGRYGINRKA